MEVTIGTGVTRIADYMFNNCSGLTSITIPNNVTEIGDDAFSSCTSLMSVTIPDSVTYIGAAFYDCNELTSVTIVANGGNAANVQQAMIAGGVDESITWNMPA